MNAADKVLFVFAKTCSVLNSGFLIEKSLINLHGNYVTVKSTFPFIAANLQYKGWEALILIYNLKICDLRAAGIEVAGVGEGYENAAEVTIYIPEMLETLVSFFSERFGQAHGELLGYLNTGGRSYWCFPGTENANSFGIKFGTYSAPEDNDAIRNRYLSVWGIKKSVANSNILAKENLVLIESAGLWLEFTGKGSESTSWKHSFLIRKWNHDQARLLADDVVLPFFGLLSPVLWDSPELLKELGLPRLNSKKEVKAWIIEQTAPWMARLLELGLFKYGIHLELHQQNISFVIRDQKVVHAVCQDLQDICEDPVQKFFLLYKENLRLKEIFTARRYSGALGEVMLIPPRVKPYATVAGWHRQYIRILGQYDRCLNVSFDGKEFEDYHFEAKVLEHLLAIASNSYGVHIQKSDVLDLYHAAAQLLKERHRQLLAAFSKKNDIPFKRISIRELAAVLATGFTYGTAFSPWRFKLLAQQLKGFEIAKARYQDATLFLIKNPSSDELHFYINVPEPPQSQLDY